MNPNILYLLSVSDFHSALSSQLFGPWMGPRPCLYARFTALFRDFYHRSQDAFFGQISLSLSPFKAREVEDEGTSKPQTQPRSVGQSVYQEIRHNSR